MEPDNPYSAPQVDLVEERASPRLPGWNPRQLQVLGALALMTLLGNLLVVGLLFASGWLGQGAQPQVELFTDWLALVVLLLSNYLLIRFKRFAEQRFSARGLGWPIWSIVLLGLVIGLVDFIFGDRVFQAANVLTIGYVGLLMLLGLVTVWAGVRLIMVRLPYASLRIMGWLYIAGGLMLATVLLMLLAILPLLAANLAMALVFLRGARELGESQTEL